MIKIYFNGLTFGKPPSKSNHKRAKREKTTGWSESFTRSNKAFLYSVDTKKLDGNGLAFTFTIKNLPATPHDFARIRKNFLAVMARMGMVRYHWVTEWQKRGVPHLHGCIYFPFDITLNMYNGVVAAWCGAAGEYIASPRGQDLKLIDSAVGWLKYLAKHGSRSGYHYQRTSKPKEWDSSGRVWGKGGEWPTRLTEHNEGDYFHQLRRVIRNWRIADARSSKIPRRIASARSCLKYLDKNKSAVLGMSEWVPESMTFRLVHWFEKQN